MCTPLLINRLLPEGNYTITAKATDNYGASTTTAPINLISDTPPTVSLTNPANNAIVHTPVNVSITADAASAMSTIAKVEFYNGTTLIGSSTTAPYSFTWNSVAVGNYSLTAVATDNYGIQTTSAPISLTVKLGELLPYYIHTDHLDTPREITDTSGNVVWQWDNADPFGNNVPNENPSGLGKFEQPLRFPGQYADKETNLNYNVNRDYDSAVGRYIQSDPIGLAGGINTYAYALGDPLLFRDPTGRTGVGLAFSGVIEGGGGPIGLGANGSVGGGAFWNTNTNQVTLGGFSTAAAFPSSSNATQFVLGAFAGAGPGVFITNANNANSLQGTVPTWALDTPWFSATFSKDKSGTWLFTVSGAGIGGGFSRYPSRTINVASSGTANTCPATSTSMH